MAYVVPVHRASSIRHAVKLQFLNPEEDCLVVAYVLLARVSTHAVLSTCELSDI